MCIRDSYTADEITQAVRDAAKALAEKNGATDAKKKVGNGLASFTMKADGKINLAASGTDTTGKLTFAAGTGKGGLTLQIGDTSASYNKLDVTINDCHTGALGIADLDIGNQKGAADALNTIKDAINYVSDVRGTLGATQNRLDHTINNLSVMQENIQDAESTIRDTDVADEMMAYTKNNILIQSAQAKMCIRDSSWTPGGGERTRASPGNSWPTWCCRYWPMWHRKSGKTYVRDRRRASPWRRPAGSAGGEKRKTYLLISRHSTRPGKMGR